MDLTLGANALESVGAITLKSLTKGIVILLLRTRLQRFRQLAGIDLSFVAHRCTFFESLTIYFGLIR